MVDATPEYGTTPEGERATAGTPGPLFPEGFDDLAQHPEWTGIAREVAEQTARVLAEVADGDEFDQDAERVRQRIYERTFDRVLGGSDAAAVKTLHRLISDETADVPDETTVALPTPQLDELLEDVSEVMGMMVDLQLDLQAPDQEPDGPFFERHYALLLQAARFLRMDDQAVLTNSRELPEDSAVYVWQPERGGGALITSDDGSVLFANSSVPFEEHLDAFRAGRRTDPVDFGS